VISALRRGDIASASAAVEQLQALHAGAGGSDSARARAHAEIGDLRSLLLDYPAADRSYTQAAELTPRESRYWFNRAAVRRFLGELAAAEDDYDRAIALAPGDAQAYLNRSELRPQTSERNHIVELERVLVAGPREWRHEVPLRYALAKEYEDLGQYTLSWQHLSAGSARGTDHPRHARPDGNLLRNVQSAVRSGLSIFL
jgi:tetratricopeptide (TPR) repeat protein